MRRSRSSLTAWPTDTTRRGGEKERECVSVLCRLLGRLLSKSPDEIRRTSGENEQRSLGYRMHLSRTHNTHSRGGNKLRTRRL